LGHARAGRRFNELSPSFESITLNHHDGSNDVVPFYPFKRVNDWKGQSVYQFTSARAYASYYIMHFLYRHGYEPNNFRFDLHPPLMPYYITSEDALALRDNRLNRLMRTAGHPNSSFPAHETNKLQFSGYNADFFAHVYCRQMFYYTGWPMDVIRAVKNYYSIMFLYSARPIWQDYINHNPDLISGQSNNPREWRFWSEDFQAFLRDNDLQPGTEDKYRFVANWLAEGHQMYTVSAGTQQQGETLLSIIFGQSAISYVFWGITLISMALCLFFTVIAVTRSMADLELQRPLGKVIGATNRAMLIFLIVPDNN
jgi:hypothetical protein